MQQSETKNLPNIVYKGLLPLFVSVLIGVSLIAVIELSLRLYGFGTPRTPLIKKEIEGYKFFVPNKAFYQQFFDIPLQEFVNWDDLDFCVPVEKSKNAVRIFVFGESAMYGLQSSARQLEVMLRRRFPHLKWEVYNFSCPGINSHILYEMAKQAGLLSPDIFIVYVGNNEAIGPYGENSSFGRLRILRRSWVIRLHIFLRRLRVAQLFERFPSSEWRKYLPTDMAKYIPGQSQQSLTLALYEKNLSDIISEGSRCGADVIVGTLSFNRLYGRENLKTLPVFEETPMNVIIKGVVEEHRNRGENVYLAEIDWTLAINSSLGIPDYTFFCDNIHFTFEGNYLVAREWFEKIVEVMNKRGVVGFPRRTTPITIEECARNLGWNEATELELVKLQKGVILDKVSQAVLVEKEKRLSAKVGENVLGKVLTAYAMGYRLNKDDEKIVRQYVDCLLKVGQTEKAFDVALAFYQSKPYLRIAIRLLANAYFNLRDYTNAEKMYKLCLAYYPDDGLARDSLGID